MTTTTMSYRRKDEMTNTYISGPQGSAVPLTWVQKLEQALGQIRAYAEAWADPGAGDAILAIIDRLTWEGL
jgi:hypothetical protein